MRFIPTSIHGVIDYVVGIALIAAPFVLGFANGGAAMWTPIIIGGGALLYSVMTSYELGLFPLLTMKAHLTLDALSGAVLAASPWLFGFQDFVWIPHVVVGLAEIFFAITTQTAPRRAGVAMHSA